jgi:hypothetical protein
MRSLCDKKRSDTGGEIATVEREQRSTFMGFTDESDIGVDEIDHVSAWILRLAIGMIVLGVVFAVLDRYELLPQLPEPPQLPHVAT